MDGLSLITLYSCVIEYSNAQSIVFMGLVPNPILRSYFLFNGTEFSNNQGIYILNANGVNGTIDSCSFSYNRIAPIYLINSDSTIRNSEFLNNTGNYSQIINYVDNDGISLSISYSITISGCTFTE